MNTQRGLIEWDPHDAQERAYRSDARFRAVAAGRRSGKTTLAAFETVERAFSSKTWMGAWVTPGHSITETGFRKIDNTVVDSRLETRKQSPPYRHEFRGGGRLDYLTTGGTANVSEGYDWVVIDEAAKDVPERAWTQELRPTLSNRDGEAMFISTPDGRGWFHDWWHRGQDDSHPDIDSFRWSTYDAPHIPDSEVDAAREEMPDRIWRQEYLAEFRDDAGGVFSTDLATADYTLGDGYGPHPSTEPPYRVAADLARSEDYLALGALGTDGRLSHLTRERGLSWPQIQDKIERVARAHGDAPVAIDATRDNKLVSDLERAGVDIRPVTFSAQRKQSLVENLAAGIEAGEVSVPEDSIVATELAVFEYETTRAGNVRYGAPDGHHDDTVDMLAMCYDMPAGGAGIPTGRATFGDGERDSDTPSETVADIIPDPTQ